MLSRTTTSVVTFLNPFVVAGYTDELAAPDIEVTLLGDQSMRPSGRAQDKVTHLVLV